MTASGASADSQVRDGDDWFFPPRSGNEVVAAMSYLNAANSQADNGEAGRRTHDVDVFYSDLAVWRGKPVAGLTLPRIGSIVEGRASGDARVRPRVGMTADSFERSDSPRVTSSVCWPRLGWKG